MSRDDSRGELLQNGSYTGILGVLQRDVRNAIPLESNQIIATFSVKEADLFPIPVMMALDDCPIDFLPITNMMNIRFLSVFQNILNEPNVLLSSWHTLAPNVWMLLVLSYTTLAIILSRLFDCRPATDRKQVKLLAFWKTGGKNFAFHLFRVAGWLLQQQFAKLSASNSIVVGLDLLLIACSWLVVQLFVGSFSAGLVTQDTDYLVNTFADALRLNRTPIIALNTGFVTTMERARPGSDAAEILRRRKQCGDECHFELDYKFVHPVVRRMASKKFAMFAYENQLHGWSTLMCNIEKEACIDHVWMGNTRYYSTATAMMSNRKIPYGPKLRMRFMLVEKFLVAKSDDLSGSLN